MRDALRIPGSSPPATATAAPTGDRGSRQPPDRGGASMTTPSPTMASLSLKIFYPDAIAADEIHDYNEAFAFWYEIWLETRREVDEMLTAPSDSFSRQSEILVLYSDGKPIATCCHRYVDLRHHCVLYDSYFSSAIWPASVKVLVPELGRTCLLGSHIFIHPAFRKCRSGLPIKNIVCAVSMTHVNATGPDVLLGAARIDKGIHKVFHDAGAVSLRDDASWYHIPVDLIALFPKKSPMRIDSQYEDIVRSIGETCHRFAVNYLQRDSAT
jgi:hypothetical protein